jgi:Zn-dependent alcohol dehydrogenase
MLIDRTADNQGGMAVLGATEPETDFPLFLEWVREGKFPLGKLVTNRYLPEQIEEARVALEEGQILGRAIIEI